MRLSGTTEAVLFLRTIFGKMELEHSRITRSQVDPRHPFRNAAEDFVGNGFADAGMFAGVDRFAVNGAEEDHFVAGCDAGDGGDVDRGEVHGDASGYGSVLAADDYSSAIGKQAVKTVRVTYWQNGDAARVLRDECAAVAYGLSGGNLFHCDH